MSLKRFRQENQASERQAEAVQELLQSINLEFLNGRFLTEVNSEGVETDRISLSTSQKLISHRLGRRYNGFIVVENSSAVAIRNVRTSQDDAQIDIRSSGNTTARVWVF